MAFAILRVGKMKSASAVGGQSDHAERERLTPNADAARLALNQRLAGTGDAWADVQANFAEYGITPQKNSVLAIDVFITASPEHFASNHPDDPNWKAFQAKAMDFLKAEYGAWNVVHAVAHHDETSPHLHAIITPIRSKTVKVGRKVKTERTENRLCARDWLGGDRTTLSKLQTRFADHVADLGLKRGTEGSRASHTEVKQFYTVMKEVVSQAQAIDQALPQIDRDHFVRSVAKPGILDLATPRQFAQAQVSGAITALQQQIEQTNHNSQIARSGQLVTLQTPALAALAEKGQNRQSQAEAALQKLGYRLDQHGQLVDILEERKNALRATISKTVKECTTFEELKPLLQVRGVKLGFNNSLATGENGETRNTAGFRDKTGWIDGKDLGQDFTTMAIQQLLAANARRREADQKQATIKAAAEAEKKAKIKVQAKASDQVKPEVRSPKIGR